MNLIDMNQYPVSNVLSSLLKDKSTKRNIIFATNVYSQYNIDVDEKTEMTMKILKNIGYNCIQPRVAKSLAQQAERTRNKAEVFTPSWICNKMNNHCDEIWFGRPGVFNREVNQTWCINVEPIQFDNENDWKKYVDTKRLEIT